MAAAHGRLLVVGTPIGNLGDLTPRAAEALRSADLVVAEDTRLATRLLRHVGARTPTSSFNNHNAAVRLPALLGRLSMGETLALTTDAGMPGVSDPGARLVEAARAAGAAVEVVPGPSAVTAAVAISGIESPGFVFGGFLPARPASARRAALQRLLTGSAAMGLPLVLFEAPHRVRSLLAELSSVAPTVSVALCRELTKVHEEVLTGTPAEVASALTEPRGEFTVVISGIVASDAAGVPVNTAALLAAAGAAGLTTRTTVELLRASGLSRRDAYSAVQDAAQ
ncbi:MAG: 16S rRNA (cytidine(1402)-2'-O)-methyltransferase [Candidatus Limnocylindria bacterium]